MIKVICIKDIFEDKDGVLLMKRDDIAYIYDECMSFYKPNCYFNLFANDNGSNFIAVVKLCHIEILSEFRGKRLNSILDEN
jgi:hypothetical protein